MNPYTLDAHGLSQGMPLSDFSKAMLERSKGHEGLTMDKVEPVCFLWAASAGAGKMILNGKSKVVEEKRIEASKKSQFFWLPAASHVQIIPDKGQAFTLEIPLNGRANLLTGAHPPRPALPKADPATLNPNEKANVWLNEGRVGVSSMAMCAHLFGLPEGQEKETDTPHDFSDLGRCVGFLDAVPEARARLHEMGTVSPEWQALVEQWEPLEKVYQEEKATGSTQKTSALLRSIRATVAPDVPRKSGRYR